MFMNKFGIFFFLIGICWIHVQCLSFLDFRETISRNRANFEGITEKDSRTNTNWKDEERNIRVMNGVEKIITRTERNVSNVRDLNPAREAFGRRTRSFTGSDIRDQSSRRTNRRQIASVSRNLLKRSTDIKGGFRSDVNRETKLKFSPIHTETSTTNRAAIELGLLQVSNEILAVQDFRAQNLRISNREERGKQRYERRSTTSEQNQEARNRRITRGDKNTQNTENSDLRVTRLVDSSVFDSLSSYKNTMLVKFGEINYFMILLTSAFIYDFINQVIHGSEEKKSSKGNTLLKYSGPISKFDALMK